MYQLHCQLIPWFPYSLLQVVGAVGFMNQKLQVPDDLDQDWATLINDCWCRYVMRMNTLYANCRFFLLTNLVLIMYSDPRRRPSFEEITDRLKETQRHLMERS